jgi:hypothetical protein
VRWLAVLALAVAAAGCSGGGGPPPAQSRSAAEPPATRSAAAPPAAQGPAGPASSRPALPLSVRVVLPARTLAAGSAMTGRVLVRNRTGHALHLIGCGGFFQVALASRTYHPTVAWPACAQRLTIPAGRSAYPVRISATYRECAQGPPQDGMLSCLPGDRMPPLPPGVYHAQFFQSRPLAAAPAPLTVRVTAPQRTR